MRQIRFRGKTPDGEVVYGDYVTREPLENKPGIIDEQEYYHEADGGLT